MGMYDHRIKRKEVDRGIHPAWRGIGCILMILIPIISIAGADVIIESNLGNIGIPIVLRTSVDTVILGVIRYFPAKLLLAVIITVALFAVLSFFYAFLYRATGQSKLGPMDAPPIRQKVKKRNL